jgi:hypothetical protein
MPWRIAPQNDEFGMMENVYRGVRPATKDTSRAKLEETDEAAPSGGNATTAAARPAPSETVRASKTAPASTVEQPTDDPASAVSSTPAKPTDPLES